MSNKDSSSISSIPLLTSENYRLWADSMKSWLQLNGLWRLVASQEKKPAEKPEIIDSSGQITLPAVPVDEERLEH